MVDSSESFGPPDETPNRNPKENDPSDGNKPPGPKETPKHNPDENDPSESDLVDSNKASSLPEDTPDQNPNENEPSESDLVDRHKSSGLPEETSDHNPNENEPSEGDHPVDELAQAVQWWSLHVERAAEHKFWESQPVCQFKDFAPSQTSLPEGPIEDPIPLSEVKKEPYNLPDKYEWITCDLESDEMCSEILKFLEEFFVHDERNMLRFNYSKEILRWALCPPGYFKSWHIGIRVKRSKKLVGFIAGAPARIRVFDATYTMAEVNFLCVHKKLRSKRLAPVMIKEMTRRVHLENVWQAAFTARIVIPTPFSSCQIWHRSLNPKKLIDIGFLLPRPWMTKSQAHKLYELPESVATPGFRKMEVKDVPAVSSLLGYYLCTYAVALDFSVEDVKHWLLPTEGIVDCYVVENAETNQITDFISFYTVPSLVRGNPNYSSMKSAHSFYNVSTRTPRVQLMRDALVLAKQDDFDVFNALNIMDSETFLSELEFGQGVGSIHYYFYNLRFQSAVRGWPCSCLGTFSLPQTHIKGKEGLQLVDCCH